MELAQYFSHLDSCLDMEMFVEALGANSTQFLHMLQETTHQQNMLKGLEKPTKKGASLDRTLWQAQGS